MANKILFIVGVDVSTPREFSSAILRKPAAVFGRGVINYFFSFCGAFTLSP